MLGRVIGKDSSGDEIGPYKGINQAKKSVSDFFLG